MHSLKKTIKRVLIRLGIRYRPQPESISEVEIIGRMFDTCRTGIMVDVGAHFGESFQTFSKRGWQVIAFEPDNDPRKQEAIHNGLNSRSKLLTCALSDTPAKETPFYRSDVSTGISGLIPFHESHQAGNMVEIDTLKAVLVREGISQVDFLKIDTEGNDLPVLKGLDWHVKPVAILCEFEDSKTNLIGYNYQVLGDYLAAAGYRVYMSEWYPIVRYGAQHKWRGMRKYPCEIKEPGSWGNFIAITPSDNGNFLNSVAMEGIILS